MNIAFTITDNYTPYCGVALCSLFENNKDIEFNVFIITDFLSKKNIILLKQQCVRYGAKIHIIELSEEQKIRINTIIQNYKLKCHKSVLYRLFISSLLEVDEALYMDSDLIVDGKINNLGIFEKNHSLKAVADLFRMSDYHRLKIDNFTHIYFNAGVLYINLKYWRDNKIEEKLLTYLESNATNLWLADQDALNAVLAETVEYLHPKWNCFSLFFAKESYLINRVWYKDLRKIHEAISHPIIIHFVGQKPWHLGGYLPHRDTWMKYYKMSEWNNKIKIDYPNGMKGRMRFYIKEMVKKLFPFYAKRHITDIYEK